MPTGKTCGNCARFIRIKSHNFQGFGRNGICDLYDYNCHSDSTYAQFCKKYKKHNKIKEIKQNEN